jgi:HTH-type transcriptional repressor of NAD biosynthesis genes
LATLRICLTGPESTGKSELSAVLHQRFGAPVVAEFAREYAERHPGELGPEHVEPIALGQIAITDDAPAAGERLVVLDTDLLSTVAYARYYYGSCPGWIEEEARRRRADRYFLLGIDTPWESDDVRDASQDREAVFRMFRDVLGEFGADYEIVDGPWTDRCARVSEAVAALLR